MNNIVKTEELINYPIFEDLNPKEIEKFSVKMEINTYSNDEIIIKEGDEGHSILFLLNGEINITKALTLITNKDDNEDNREKEFIRISSENNNICFGEISLFSDNKKRSATVKAISKCKAARLAFNDLFEICNKNHDIGYKIMKNISKIISNHLIESDKKVLKLTTAFSLLIEN